jgi:hypothetical protein
MQITDTQTLTDSISINGYDYTVKCNVVFAKVDTEDIITIQTGVRIYSKTWDLECHTLTSKDFTGIDILKLYAACGDMSDYNKFLNNIVELSVKNTITHINNLGLKILT